ncbi:MAG: 2-oxo acid dehydrogenase subunit E2 [Ignavibacteria bacterium]|jgi:pyruvate dehydrogenase E2 component (dihydrolipoamide acetyltransferase)
MSEFKLPELGENIDSADVVAVLIKVGDKIEKDQNVIEIETDKATVEVPSDIAGTVKEVYVKAGDTAKVAQVLFTIEGGAATPKVESKEEPKQEYKGLKELSDAEIKKLNEKPESIPVSVKREMSSKIAPASPSVRRFAREIGVDINMVRGSGPGGRISIEDVKAFAKNINEEISKGGIPSGAGVGIKREPLPDFSKWGDIEIKPMTNVRKKTAEHLSYAWATIPHVTQMDKADITDLDKLRKKYSAKVEKSGGKLTVTAMLVKVVASALKVFPQFNSSIDMEKKEIIYKNYYNIGIAVDTDRGLIVPTIKDADKMNITEISVALTELSIKARDKKTSIEEMQGGTFTISNLGGIGGTYFTPIVNSPEVAILGISRSAWEPKYIDGKFEPRFMMPLSLSYDHRIIDGADAIRFLRWVIDALENPFLLSLEG